MKLEHMGLSSATGAELNIEALERLAPACITEVADPKTGRIEKKVNFAILKELLGEQVLNTNREDEAYRFTWVGKAQARREAVRRTNQTLRPIIEDSVDWDTTENLYIEGDNLAVLKLLQKSYLGKVKMIYIDPPYNTGNDFVYNDSFAHSAAQERLANGDVDEEGNVYRKNSDTNGRYHSDWCSMIYPRLMLARNLLTEDGVIFISIDDNEVANLKKICDEVFGGGNFVGQLVWERAFSPKNDARFISNSHDYVLMYAKEIDSFEIGRLERTEEANARYSNPDNDPRGVWMSSDISVKTYNASCDYPITTPSGKIVEPPAGRCWSLSAKAFAERLQDNRIWFGPNGDNTPRIKRFLSELKFEGMAPTSILFYKEVGHSQEGAQEVVSLFGDKGVFDGPKPVRLLQRLITLANLKEDSIVLDFFSGSATTAHALMQHNATKQIKCKFILVQLPEEVRDTKKDSGYATICEIGKERIRRAGQKIKEASPLTTQKLDTGFRVLRLDESNMKDVYFSPKSTTQDQLELWLDNVKDGRTDLDLLFGCMLDWGLPLTMPLSRKEVDGCTIHTVNNGNMVACFSEGITPAVVDAIAEQEPERIILRDGAFASDHQKINLYETLKQKLNWTDSEAFHNVRVI